MDAAAATAQGPEAHRDFVEAMRDMVIGFGADGVISYVNPAATTLLGWPDDDLTGRNVADFIHPDDIGRALEVIGVVAENPGSWPVTPAVYRVRRRDGTYISIEFNSPPAASSALGHIVTVGRRSGDQLLHRQVLELLTGGRPADDALAFVPEFGRWRHPTERYLLVVERPEGGRKVFGDAVPAPLDGSVDILGSPFDRARTTRAEVQVLFDDLPPELRHAAQTAGLTDCWVVPVADPMTDQVVLLIAWSSDANPPITVHRWPLVLMEEVLTLVLQWRHHLDDLQQAALHDALTGAANRNHFFAALTERSTDAHTAVLYVDLDGFKAVNDRLGHHAGDLVLIEVTRRLEAAVRPDDLVARLGGDEFAVLCSRLHNPADATDIATRVVEAVSQPMLVAGTRVDVGASIGIAITGAEPGEWLLDQADRALYEVKKQGKGTWRLADTS